MHGNQYDRQRIWDAAYAAAFVQQFNRSYSALVACGERNFFDVALAGNAEAAITIADAAVRQLDEWVSEGNQI